MIGRKPIRSESLCHEPRRTCALPTRRRRPSADAEQLLSRVGRGDEQAFAAVYDLLGAAVYGLARRVVRDPARAEEIAQEVFIQVGSPLRASMPPRQRQGLGLDARPPPSGRRGEARSGATNRENRYDWSSGPDFDEVEETVSTTLEHEQVRRCLDGLTELQREAVNLAYYNGHTYAEVAEVLDTNPATIKTRYPRRPGPSARLMGVPA